MPGASVSPPRLAPGSAAPGRPARSLNAISASAAAACAAAKVAAVPSAGQVMFGGGAAVMIVPFTAPWLSGVSVYAHPVTRGVYGIEVSWNPVISVEAPVVPIDTGWPCAPTITVLKPWLVIPALPPRPPNAPTAPRAGAAPAGPGDEAAPGSPTILPSSPPPHAAMEPTNNEAINSCHALDLFSNLTIGIPLFSFNLAHEPSRSVGVYPPSVHSQLCATVLKRLHNA